MKELIALITNKQTQKKNLPTTYLPTTQLINFLLKHTRLIAYKKSDQTLAEYAAHR
jgi:hypothetical protein